jgi:hypothetical protein
VIKKSNINLNGLKALNPFNVYTFIRKEPTFKEIILSSISMKSNFFEAFYGPNTQA